MNSLQLTSLALAILVIGCLVDVNDGIFLKKRRMNRKIQQADNDDMACGFMSNMFSKRQCVSRVKPGVICRMLNFMITMSDYECQEFPCNGFGQKTGAVCVRPGSCSRLTLSKGMCDNGNVCCLAGNGGFDNGGFTDSDSTDNDDRFGSFDNDGLDNDGFDNDRFGNGGFSFDDSRDRT